MQIIAHTPEGIYASKTYPDSDSEYIYESILTAAKGEHDPYVLETDDGYIVIGSDILSKTVFVVTE